MEHTRLTVIKALESRRLPLKLLKVSLILLPFVSYVGLVGLVGVIILTLKQQGKQVFRSRVVQGLIAIAVGLITNATLAVYKGEAFLQLANFIPFFLLFAVLITLLETAEQLQDIAWSLVVASIPIHIAAVIEYVLKAPEIKASLSDWSLLGWFYRNDYGHRANSFFGHPNTYASYLIIILALELGLILLKARQSRASPPSAFTSSRMHASFWLYGATALTWVGISCAGSRNGLAIALTQLVLLIIIGRNYRALRITGLLGLLLLVGGALVIGIGERQATWNSLVQGVIHDPRLGVWKIALDLIRERPFLGWGLGNYKLLYPPRSVDPRYPNIAHAHNFWLLMGSEAGLLLAIALTFIVGYICYRGVYVFLSKHLDPSTQTLLMGYLLAVWGFIVFAMLDLPFYDARINALNWFVLSGVYVLSHRSPGQLDSQK